MWPSLYKLPKFHNSLEQFTFSFSTFLQFQQWRLVVVRLGTMMRLPKRKSTCLCALHSSEYFKPLEDDTLSSYVARSMLDWTLCYEWLWWWLLCCLTSCLLCLMVKDGTVRRSSFVHLTAYTEAVQNEILTISSKQCRNKLS